MARPSTSLPDRHRRRKRCQWTTGPRRRRRLARYPLDATNGGGQGTHSSRDHLPRLQDNGPVRRVRGTTRHKRNDPSGEIARTSGARPPSGSGSRATWIIRKRPAGDELMIGPSTHVLQMDLKWDGVVCISASACMCENNVNV